MDARNLTAPARRGGLWWFGGARGAGVGVSVTGCAVTAGASGPRAGTAPAATGGSSNPPAAADRPADEAADAAAVAAAYQRLRVVAETVPPTAPARWGGVLSTVAAEPLLTQPNDGFQAQRDAGRRDHRTVVLHPSAVAVECGTASLLDCQEASRSGELDLDTERPRTLGHTRTPPAATLSYEPDARISRPPTGGLARTPLSVMSLTGPDGRWAGHRDDGRGRCVSCGQRTPCRTHRIIASELTPRARA